MINLFKIPHGLVSVILLSDAYEEIGMVMELLSLICSSICFSFFFFYRQMLVLLPKVLLFVYCVLLLNHLFVKKLAGSEGTVWDCSISQVGKGRETHK